MSIKPKLGFFDTTIVVISLVIGIGIFRTPAMVAKEAGTPTIFFACWIAGGILCLFGALTFAEIGSRKPYAGGFYKLASDAYHPAFAFMLNWLGLLISSGATFAAVALLASEYITPLIPIAGITSPVGLKLTAVGLILVLFIINYTGIKSGATTLNILTTVKVAIILILCISAFVFSNVTPESKILANNSNAFNAFGLGLISVFFTYGGYQLTMNLAADVKNPNKNLKWGILLGAFVIIFVYLLTNVAYYKILGLEGISNSPLIAADVAKVIFGETGGKIISIVIFISALGFLNVTLMHTPRTFLAIAEDGALPEIFKRVNQKTQTQEFTLIFLTTLSLFFLLVEGQFEKIINLIMFNDNLTIAFVASTIFIFRYRDSKKEYGGFKSPLYPVIPAIFIFFLVLVSFYAFSKDITAGLLSTAVFLLGYPIFLLFKKFVKK